MFSFWRLGSLASIYSTSICPSKTTAALHLFYYYTRPCKMSTSNLSSVLHLGKVGGPTQLEVCWVPLPNPYALSLSPSLVILPELTGELPNRAGPLPLHLATWPLLLDSHLHLPAPILRPPNLSDMWMWSSFTSPPGVPLPVWVWHWLYPIIAAGQL